MLKRPRCIYLLVLVIIYLMCWCDRGTTSAHPTTNNSFSVVVFSDVHFNPFYDPSLFRRLVSSDASEWASIFKTSRITAPSAWNSDTNYPLLVLALSSIRRNLGASPLIICTGDLLGHYIPQTFYQLYGSHDEAAMKAFTDKTFAFVARQVRSSVRNIPVMFAVGNIDSYTGYGPDSSFLSNTAELVYTHLLNGAVDHQAFLNTFTSGGYYSAEPLGRGLVVIGLNTNPFASLVPGDNDFAVDTELAWLDSRLASAKARGQKVWLLMHVPPGADTVTTATKNLDKYGHLASATMMWKPDYQGHFLQILSNYPGVVTLTLAAHTHMDEYRILSPYNVLDQAPAISPCFGNDPAFKVLTFTHHTFTPTDYRSVNYDLATLPGQFNSYYTFSAAYSMQGPLDSSLAQLYPALVTNNAKQALYRGLYESGHNSASPITNTNWPVFACGIGKMAQSDFIDCVNSY